MGLFDILFGWMRPRPGNIYRSSPEPVSPLPAPDRPVSRQARQDGHGGLATLKQRLGLNRRRLAWYAFHAGSAYHSVEVPKRDGTTRRLDIPVPALRFIQRRIMTRVLYKVPLDECVKGFRRRRSIFGNARPHVGKPMVLNLDLKDFFPSITAARVFGLFRALGMERAEAGVATRLTTFDGRLPQGAPSSPAISNLVCRRMDRRLSGLARKVGAAYTRYADDITFSGPATIRSILPLVRRIIAAEGFAVAEHKVHVTRPCRRQQVTGLVVNQRVAVPRALRRRLRAMVHNCVKFGLSSQNRTGQSDARFLAQLRGRIEFVRMIDRPAGEALLAQLQRARPRS